MKLSNLESGMARGAEGRAVQTAMEFQLQLGEFYGATRMVEITNAHFTGDFEVMGQGGLDYLVQLADEQARVRVPTSRNSTCVDPVASRTLRQNCSLTDGELRVGPLLGRMGVVNTNTCIGYQTLYTPVLGEHVAWGDTGTVAYANSVLGARTNFEAGPASLFAGITGRTPAYGYHLPENRRGNVIVRVESPMADLADWGALGAIVGETYRGYWNVPVFEFASARPTPDRFKHLAASLASYGSMAMFHAVGATPEAAYVEQAIDGRDVVDRMTVTEDAVLARFSQDGLSGQRADIVVFTAPQLSLWELRDVARRLTDRRAHPDVDLICTTNAGVAAMAESEGVITALGRAGVTLLRGTCWYLMDPSAMATAFGWKRVVTNSAKLANIVRAHGYEPALRRTGDCIESAITGEIP